jgi:hypothetical protein
MAESCERTLASQTIESERMRRVAEPVTVTRFLRVVDAERIDQRAAKKRRRAERDEATPTIIARRIEELALELPVMVDMLLVPTVTWRQPRAEAVRAVSRSRDREGFDR